ncbi:unnamed protein product [Polarella glacialis]|uniref:Uncharacterized protein n=2 Tax=Polarella glacialis TaxID=89957 RepID=A0A813LF76_POLGL|nr:unnamed protein product [Polarella glacialis]
MHADTIDAMLHTFESVANRIASFNIYLYTLPSWLRSQAGMLQEVLHRSRRKLLEDRYKQLASEEIHILENAIERIVAMQDNRGDEEVVQAQMRVNALKDEAELRQALAMDTARDTSILDILAALIRTLPKAEKLGKMFGHQLSFSDVAIVEGVTAVNDCMRLDLTGGRVEQLVKEAQKLLRKLCEQACNLRDALRKAANDKESLTMDYLDALIHKAPSGLTTSTNVVTITRHQLTRIIMITIASLRWLTRANQAPTVAVCKPLPSQVAQAESAAPFLGGMRSGRHVGVRNQPLHAPQNKPCHSFWEAAVRATSVLKCCKRRRDWAEISELWQVDPMLMKELNDHLRTMKEQSALACDIFEAAESWKLLNLEDSLASQSSAGEAVEEDAADKETEEDQEKVGDEEEEEKEEEEEDEEEEFLLPLLPLQNSVEIPQHENIEGWASVENRSCHSSIPVPDVAAPVMSISAAQDSLLVIGLEQKLQFDKVPLRYWDPIGLANDGDQASFRRRRISEIKCGAHPLQVDSWRAAADHRLDSHTSKSLVGQSTESRISEDPQNGRVAMIATIGWILPEYYRFPGYLSPSQDLKFADVPGGMQALAKVPAEGWAQIGVFVAFLELFPMRQEKDRVPGDFPGFGKIGLPIFGSTCDPAKSERSLNAELNNGRLAMLAISGMAAQNGLFGTTGSEMWMPASAFESEMGVQAPVGFWDPAGLAKDGDADAFRRRRGVELKHGRICMLACIGYIVPEYFRWPGYLSPAQGLKFTDVPHGLAAISKVPLEGWLQIGLFLGHYEGFFMRQEPGRAPGDFANHGFLGIGKNFIFNFEPASIADPAARKGKLNSEIANGRLAMVALMAMLFQNGTVGTTGPAMWLGASAFESELGVQAPVGFWDPAGLAKDGDADAFRRRRGVELKHGRICMLACIGYIVPEYFRWPGYLSPSQGLKFTDVPHGLAAVSKVPLEGWLQVGLFLGHMEGFFMRQDPKRAPGDFENHGFLGIGKNFLFNFEPPTISNPEARKAKLSSEIANGRLAMVALMAMFFQNGTVGSTGPEMWLPSSAFESELGVQAPVGFWDPAGLAKDGDADAFRRRRGVELKHGRICMLACIGYIVPEYFRWPGYLSPSQGLKFTDVPHGLAAVSKVPLEGWLQVGLFLGHMEGFFMRQDPKRAPGDFENHGFLGIGKNFLFNFEPPTISNPEARKAKLSSEIANGRLAMVALMAMFFQNGTVGSTGPEMWLPSSAFESELGVQAPVDHRV